MKSALLDLPHVAIAGDGEMSKKLRALAANYGGTYQPELVCDGVGQCLSAVKSGRFAAVLPTQAWEQISDLDCETISDPRLVDLDRPLVLAWSKRNVEAYGKAMSAFQEALIAALTEEATRMGLMSPTETEDAR